jgi:hypothetical protein
MFQGKTITQNVFSMIAWDHLFVKNQNNSVGDTSAKGYAIVPYIRGFTELIKGILSNGNRVALKPYFYFRPYFRKAERSC